MSDENPEDRQLRLLAEYTEKVVVAERTFQRSNLRRTFPTVGMLVAVSVGLILWMNGVHASWPFVAVVVSEALFGLVFWVMSLDVARWRGEGQLAAWRLRRVYELASRREDTGPALPLSRQLEFDLRLSEAQYMINLMERLGEPKSKEARLVLRDRTRKHLANPAASTTDQIR